MPAITHGLASVGASVVPTPHLPSPHLLPSDIFHHLGQYSPWFPADTSSDYADPPDQCAVTFVSQLERHGSRYPTAGAYRELRKTLRQIAKHLERVPDTGKGVKATEGLDPHLKWLRRWVQSKKSEDGGMRNRLGNSELTPYGQYEAYSSGWRFYEQYAHLFEAQQVDVNVDYDVESDRSGAHSNPWLDSICAAPQTPAESSAWSTLQGRPAVLDDLKGGKPHRRIDHLPKPDVIIPEARKSDKLGQVASNNTLDVYTCSAFERDYRDNARSPASIKTAAFAANATTAIRDRLASQLGVRKGGSKDRRGERIHLEPRQVLQLFSLCAFDTVARLDPYGLLYGDSKRNEDAVSPFCSLFKPEEYASIYEITTDMEKDYGFAAHNPLHRALATPWLRELLARMEDRSPVMIPPTSINTTLDGDQRTFPVPSAKGPRAFADFTHDNQLAPIISALNLWDEKHTWVTSTTTPFSGRLTVEKLECGKDEYVRILVNGQPASTSEGSWCPSSDDGFVLKGDQLCPLSTFLQPLKWVDHADEWDKCYSKKGKKVESSDASFP
uniref:3-phytase A n=1 Tax=Kalmanozyma brasiliensis (strain GHG001) TaxID=1365824 RepID=V5EPB9_KALBG